MQIADRTHSLKLSQIKIEKRLISFNLIDFFSKKINKVIKKSGKQRDDHWSLSKSDWLKTHLDFFAFFPDFNISTRN